MDDDNKIDFKLDKDKIFKFINTDRFKVWKSGYKFDKWIFQLIMFSIFGLMFFIAYSNNFELNYYKCPSPAPNDFIKGMPPTLIGMGLTGDQNTNCINPFYKAPDWTNEKTLPPGEYGFIPGPLFNNVGTIATVLFIIGLLLNHLIYNKSFFKKRRF